MSTIIKKEHLTVHVLDELDRYSDGTIYRVMETNYESPSQQLAINNAFAYLRKMWRRFLRKKNRNKREIEIRVPDEKEKIVRIRKYPPGSKKKKKTDVEYLVSQSVSRKNRIVLPPEIIQQIEEDDLLLKKLLKNRKLKPLKRRRLKKPKTKEEKEAERIQVLTEEREREKREQERKELKKKLKTPRRRKVFVKQDDEQLALDTIRLKKLEKRLVPVPVRVKRKRMR